MQTGMQEFHRERSFFKISEYLLITHSFPHSPQTFPQDFSTACPCCGYSFLVHIKYAAARGRIPHFFAGGVFYYGGIFVQKFGLDRPVCARWVSFVLSQWIAAGSLPAVILIHKCPCDTPPAV